ncbi:MAG TPA: hypothetical protein VN541_15100, partial [Tepidisphaeraceae bacterium]|nr:hypothetical protein [Tepidisphaeraceae bacterium]
MRKRMQVLVAVVLLAWATQTLLHQWGYGAEVPQDQQLAEKFVPGTARFAAGATLEMRGDATVIGDEVRLRQICRWSNADASVFSPVADLVICRFKGRSPFRTVTVDEIRNTLHDAGVNLAVVKFAGPLSCTVGRSDTPFDEKNALQSWADAKQQADDAVPASEDKSAAPISHHAPQLATGSQDTKTAPVPVFSSKANGADASPVKTLRSMLVADLSTRLGLPVEQLQVTFNPKDEKLLNLSTPLFQFNIEPRQVHDLGEVS